MELNFVLVIAYGLPSSGKTTLIKRAISAFEKDPLLGRFECLHLEVDSLETLLSSGTKLAEESVSSLSQQIGSARNLPYKFDKISNENAQQFCYEFVRKLTEKLPKSQGKGQSSPLIVFLDDNNIKKGIRRRFMKLCRNSCVAFVELFAESKLELAIERASLRKEKLIAKEVILRDFESAEFEPGEFTLVFNEEFFTDDLLKRKFLEIALNSKKNFEEFNLLKNEEKEKFQKSFWTKVDELLKKIVRETILSELANSESFNFQTKFSKLKKEYFENLKKLVYKDFDVKELSEENIKKNFTQILEKELKKE